MTLNDAIEGQSPKNTQLMQKALFVLVLAASLVLAFRRHDGILLAAVLTLAAVVIPVAGAIVRSARAKTQQRETEGRLIDQTRSYLQQVEPVRVAPVPEKVESDIELLARAIDGSRFPVQDFKKFIVNPFLQAAGYPVVFDALPRRYAVRSLYERRFADLASAMPRPVALPLNELMPTSQTEESGRWEGGAGSPVIEYSNTVLEEIRIRAAEGYQRMRHGGVEVGGVLFGSREDGILRIAAVRPIACGYSNGPRFILSPADEAALAELLLAAADDPALAGLEPLGYYHSHTREEIHMSEANLRLFDRFFPEAWQIALVVRPANLAPTRAGFFFRGPNGVMHSDSGCLEFQLA